MKNKYRNWIEWIVLVFLAIRPSLDIFTDITLLPPPLKLNPASFLGISLIVLGAVWFLLLEKNERNQIIKQPITIALMAWLGLLFFWALVPFLKHGSEGLPGIREWVRLLSYLPLFCILFYLAWQGYAHRILTSLFLSFIIPALVGYYQVIFHAGEMIKGVHRITGTFVHPNPFSFYLVLMLGITYWKIRWANKKPLWGLLLLVEVGLLLSTFSFTGAAMFGMLILGCVMGESRKIRLAAVAMMVIFVLGFMLTSTGWQRIIDETRIESLDEVERTGKETTSLIWRLLNWRFLIRTWEKSPWVGYGLETSPQINPMKNPEGVGSAPHNDYIRYLAETGILGEIIWLVFLIVIGLGLREAIQKSETRWVGNFIWVAFALYAAWLVGSLNDNLITATAYQYCLWAVFAAAAGWAVADAQKYSSSAEADE